MTGANDIEKLIAELASLKTRGSFKTFIDYIVFPRYRNIITDTRIDFTYPITVLVGQNGSGKTAVLQALFGAPGGSSVARWWFETAVDPILEPPGAEARKKRAADLPSDRRSAFYYGYRYAISKDKFEDRYVLKLRIREPNDPDYWEPSRPLAKYGLKPLPKGRRYDPIEMTPVYVNFKSIVNAFDKCFYFHSPLTLSEFAKSSVWRKSIDDPKVVRKSPRVQDYLRYKSRKLKRVLDEGTILQHAGKYPLNRTVRMLSDAELKAVNSIIGKNYIGGKVVEHRFFEGWGTTVAFKTQSRQYTDAFAGSGEGAVVRLVLEVESAKPGSLVLLDEPETSLHPGAQERMLTYLLERIKRKQLQVIISTHSPTLVQHLPREAIKVFSLNADGLAEVIPDRPAEEAFHYIGHRYDASINIVVEDRLAKAVVDAAIQSKGPAFAKRFSVSFGPGGDSSIKKDITVYSRGGVGPIILLDGDQTPAVGEGEALHVDTSKIAIGDRNPAHLMSLIEKQAGSQIEFAKNSNMSDDEKSDIYVAYLDYYHRNVYYLPFATPEEAIWDDAACQLLLQIDSEGQADEKTKEILTIDNYKRRFARLSELTNSVDAIHNQFIRRFSHMKGEGWQQLVDLVARIGDEHV